MWVRPRMDRDIASLVENRQELVRIGEDVRADEKVGRSLILLR